MRVSCKLNVGRMEGSMGIRPKTGKNSARIWKPGCQDFTGNSCQLGAANWQDMASGAVSHYHGNIFHLATFAMEASGSITNL